MNGQATGDVRSMDAHVRERSQTSTDASGARHRPRASATTAGASCRQVAVHPQQIVITAQVLTSYLPGDVQLTPRLISISP